MVAQPERIERQSLAEMSDAEMRRELGARLRNARFRAGLTQREAGEFVDMKGPQVSRLEKGRTDAPDVIVILRLAEVYGVSPEVFFENLWATRVFGNGEGQPFDMIVGEGAGQGHIQTNLLIAGVT